MSESIPIGKEEVPAPGLGTYQLTGTTGEQAISSAISIGYRHIDTAHFYHNEEVVGKAVKKSGIARNQFFITTKVWPTSFTKKDFIPSVELSLKKLQSPYVDLLLLHWPSDEEANARALDFLSECHHKGYAKLIGVSNFNIAELEKARKKAPIFCNQIEYNPYINQREMANYLQQNDLLLTAYTPLARGKVSKDPVFISLGEKYGKTPTQIALRWFIQQRNVCPIPKGGSEKHLMENMQLFDFKLTDEDMQLLFNLSA
jgi:2,5-diketo-D-gluconate reductase B